MFYCELRFIGGANLEKGEDCQCDIYKIKREEGTRQLMGVVPIWSGRDQLTVTNLGQI